MRRLSLAPMLVFGLLACRPAAPTNKPEPKGEAPGEEVPVFVEQAPTPTEDAPKTTLAPITPGECPAAVDVAPSAFFEDRVLVRLPVGLGADDMSEEGQLFVQNSNPVYFTDCRDGDDHGVMLTYAGLTLQLDQDALSIEASRDFGLNEFGYSNDGLEFIEGFEDPNGKFTMWVVADPGAETIALVAVKKSAGFVVVMLLETTEDGWPALVDTFVESGKRLLLVPG